MMGRFRTSDGVTLAFRDEGRGLPVLALAGLTRNAADFDYLAPHLGDVRLVRLDYRGRGASDHADPATYTVPVEARDVLELLDHLSIPKAAIIGTSRGGLIGMFLAATAPERLRGLFLNDVGPVIERAGLERIFDYVGVPPAFRTVEEAARAMPALNPGFEDVPHSRWVDEVRRRVVETANGLALNYDPRLREAFLAAFEGPPPDLWPLFDALDGLPVGLLRGANSDLLSAEAAAEMRRRRPDMVFAEVPGRGHVPFLDEPESLSAIRAWLERLS
ncbi:MAG: alpha/beta hydrolase [Alphaproteobacteria bacterium]|nr:MAG: alpha/beta hydrolase [Alphaproteobacteria bacterium]